MACAPFTFPYLCVPVGSMPLSGLSVAHSEDELVHTVTQPTSDEGTLNSQRPSLVGGGWLNSQNQDISHASYPQINSSTYHSTRADLSQSHSYSNRFGGAEMPRSEGLISGTHSGIPVVRAPSTLAQTTFPWFNQSPYTMYTSGQEGPSMDVIPNNFSQYFRVNRTLDNSMLSVPLQSTYPTVMETYKQRVPHDLTRLPQKRARRPTAILPCSWRQPTTIHKSSRHRRRYFCNNCSKEYAQLQGLRRHQREIHEVRLCIYCDKYKCARPYLLKEHIKKCHPDIDPNTSLEEATRIAGSHKATMVASDLLRERGSSPTPELNGSHGDEAQSHRLVLPSLPITQALPASLPVVPTVHCDPQSYARTPFSFTEEHPQTTRDSDLTYVRYSKNQSGLTVATNRLSSEAISKLTMPVSGYDSDPVSVTATTDPPESSGLEWACFPLL